MTPTSFITFIRQSIGAFKTGKLGFLIATTFFVFLIFGFAVPQNLKKKVNKEIQKTFLIDQFTLVSVTVEQELENRLPAKTHKHLFQITIGGENYGFLYVNRARSKTAFFDYMVLLNNQRVVVHSKVLIYREEYGGEIGSKRWLKQFNGKNETDELIINQNIDGISGATISVRSMTTEMNKLLETINLLHQNKAL